MFRRLCCTRIQHKLSEVYAMEGGREVELLGVVQAQAVRAQPENYLAAGPGPEKLGAWMPSWVINAGNRQGK